MQEKIVDIDNRLSILQSKVESLEKNYFKLEAIEAEVHSIRNSLIKMEMVDVNLIEKLEGIKLSIDRHIDGFAKHDEKEMEKYGSIDKRLIKIEKVIYAAIIGVVLLEALHRFGIIKVAI